MWIQYLYFFLYFESNRIFFKPVSVFFELLWLRELFWFSHYINSDLCFFILFTLLRKNICSKSIFDNFVNNKVFIKKNYLCLLKTLFESNLKFKSEPTNHVIHWFTILFFLFHIEWIFVKCCLRQKKLTVKLTFLYHNRDRPVYVLSNATPLRS